ncbi:Hypothetical_protein [Hexamita inflata]|uniref:Hypothetical_protein n=1 Tax=Hexamita inflata TaxID=28002 RepID=A0AA86UTE8_9EUKA|nr:Hypothetical protein HINF_LOCUS36813 [Hexamita inflata]CAI9949172.1 Hypothetical protein HINF_LOCUS36817 [Hexamita inflata]
MGDEICFQEKSLCQSRCDKGYCIDHNTTFCCSDYSPYWKYWAWGIVVAVFAVYVISYVLWKTCQERKLNAYQKLSGEPIGNQNTRLQQAETVVQRPVLIEENTPNNLI